MKCPTCKSSFTQLYASLQCLSDDCEDQADGDDIISHIKAEAVREIIMSCPGTHIEDSVHSGEEFFSESDLLKYADKLERGEQ